MWKTPLKLHFIFIALALSTAMLFQNCGAARFSSVDKPSESGDVSGQDVSVDPNNPSLKSRTETFQTQLNTTTSVSSMDVIWVVDTSGSMTQEAAHVRNNILRFANSFSGDARMILIGNKGSSGNAVTIPRGDSRFTQLDLTIGSTDSLRKLLQLWDGRHSLSGALAAAWRPGVPKALIIVSDDNSSISADQFLNSIPDGVADEVKVVHSIVGLENKSLSPCMARSGAVYRELSKRTDGEIFNICETDWSGIFDQLAEKIESKLSNVLKTDFKVSKSEIKKLLSVSLNGHELAAGDFSFAADRVAIKEAAFLKYASGLSTKFTIEIRYIYEE
jgi:hypothetical protein